MGTPEFWRGEIPWVTPKDMKVERIADSLDHITEEALCRTSIEKKATGSILAVVRGMILAHSFPVAVTEAEVTINQDMKSFLCEEGLDGEFLFFCLRGFEKEIAKLATESAHGTKKLETGTLKRFTLPIPPVPEQKGIVRFVRHECGRIDRLIAKKRSLLAALAEQRMAVITSAVTRGLYPTAPLKDSGIPWLGKVPKHWEVRRLKFNISKANSGVTPKGGAESYELEGIPLLRSQNIYVDGLRLDDVVFISEETHAAMINSQVASGDVLVNITGASIGRCNFVPDGFGEANVNQHVCIVRPESTMRTEFLYHVLASKVGQTQIDLEQGGSGREGLNFAALKNFEVPVPSTDEQREIERYIEKQVTRFTNLASKTAQAIDRLTEYRTAQITAATTGKIDVREVKIPKQT